ncbi:MAG: aspartate/glutamate racemase family protein [Chloroflexi bacterium]|nr:aspartate/glutamate racemase family protein [Chloroflexota bacterium]
MRSRPKLLAAVAETCAPSGRAVAIQCPRGRAIGRANKISNDMLSFASTHLAGTELPARIALVHATELAVEPINQAFAELYPEAQLSNILDDSLLSDLGANGGEVAPELLDRLASLVRYGETAGADAVLLTCSSFGPAAAEFGELVDVPFFRADDALIDAALQRGTRVGVVATVPSAVTTAEQALESAAAEAGLRVEISSVLCADSFAALKAGDQDRADRLVAEAAAALARDCDVVILAQYSMTGAIAKLPPALSERVLSSPHQGVIRLKSLFEGAN